MTATAVVTAITHASVNSAPIVEKAVSPKALPQWAENCTVKVDVALDANGVPQIVKTAEWTPSELSHPVVAAVREWKFKPMIVDGQAVPSRVIVPVHLVREFRGSAPRVALRSHKA